jgi:hypothetical protein
VVVYPDGKPLKFSPQATAGLALGQINRMISYLGGTPAAEHRDLFPNDKGTINWALGFARDQVREAHPELEQSDADQLVGLVTLLCNYLQSAESIQINGNTKSIAGVLMSRTDFVHNFRQLPENIRTHYENDPAAFAELVTGSATGDTAVFPRQVERGSAGARIPTEIRLTTTDWLTGIPSGVDRLKNLKNFTENERNLLFTEQREDSQAIHKSLGELGSVDDQVGPQNAQVTAVVAEFRRIKDGKETKDLLPLALNIFDLVTMINEGQPLPPAAPSDGLTPTNLDRGVLSSLADLLHAAEAATRALYGWE